MSDKKNITALLDQLSDQGWRVQRGKKHIMVFPPNKGQSPVTIAVTPSDHRAYQNIVSMCRKRGAQIL